MNARRATRVVLALLVALAFILIAWWKRERANDSSASPPAAAHAPSESLAASDFHSPEPVALRSPAEVAAESQTPEVVFVASDAAPPIPIRLYGVVLPAEGRSSLSRAPTVLVTDQMGVMVTSEADARGSYSVSDLAPGRHWVQVYSSADGNARVVVDLERATPERRLDLPLVLPPEILVRAVDRAGRPINGFDMLAVATLEAPGEWLEDLTGGSNNPFGVGHFWQSGYGGPQLPDGFIGRVLLDVEPPVFLSLVHYQRVVATQRVDKGQKEVEFVLDRDAPVLQTASLRFRLIDAESNAVIAATMVSISGTGSRLLRPTDGVVNAVGLAPGLYEISARAQGHERLDRRLRLEAGSENDLGDVPLGRECWITGNVVDTEGNCVQQKLTVAHVDRATGLPLPALVIRGIEVEDDGSFLISGLSRDVYALRCGGRDGTWAETTTFIDVTEGSVDGVRIELAVGVPVVLSAADERWSSARFRIFDANKAFVLSTRFWFHAPQRVLLAPGRYTLETTLAGAEPKRVEFTLEHEPLFLSLP
ncbi:MAG: hypothetical protein K8S98_00335 [Planctomycetes bacterium]|nr:hypothetical protein [Planctomycetota bacterium]